MDKYFVIKRGSQLYKDYFQYVEDAKNNAKVFDDFAKERGIESNSFLPRKKYLCIVPTEKDKDKFRNDFTQNYMDGGLRQFKVRSQVGSDWVRTVSNIRIAIKPDYFGLIRVYGRYSERLFHIGEVLYGSLSANCNFELHECMKEIKASEFYKIIEDYKESLKNKES